MRTFLRNLSIRGKLMTGFGIIVLIMFITGIRELMVLNNLNSSRLNTSKAIETANLLKESRFIIKMEIGVLNKLTAASTDDELGIAEAEHLQQSFKFNEIVNLILENTSKTQEEDYLDRIKIIRDSLAYVKKIYNSDIIPAFNDISKEKNKYINLNTYYNEHIKIAKGDTNQLNFNIQRTKDSLRITITDIINSRSDYINETGTMLTKRLKTCEKLSQNIASESEAKTEEIYTSKVNETFIFIIIIILISLLISFGISQVIISPIKELQEHINILTRGELPDHLEVRTNDEIGEMGNFLNKLVQNLKKTAQFSIEIGKGNFETNYRPVSNKDVLGNSLLSMRDSLRTAKEEEEKRKTEDSQRSRTSEGLALFGNILRKHTDNLQEFADDIISNLVKFMNANQGGLFILNDENKDDIHLNLIGAYAYNRKKHISKKIKPGEGLIGAVAEEKYTIYMTDIPNEYIEIESGIGHANPTCLLIVPLKIEDQVLGVIELASFQEFEKYEITLVEKISESIASTLSTAKINARTAELLDKSEKATVLMREKEEEMLQNIEELQATQEESKKREKQLREILAELDAAQKALKQKDLEQEQKIKELQAQNEKQLKEIQNKEAIRNIIMQTSINAIILLNSKYEIEIFNKAAERHFKYSAEEVIGKKISYLFDRTIPKEEEDSYIKREILSRGKEGKIIAKDKSIVPVYYSIKDFTHDGSTKYSVFLKNISWEKKLEAQRTKLLEEVMATEFENEVRIEKLEELLKENGIKIIEEEFDKELIRWTDKFSIDLSVIDQQHKRWIHFINRLYNSFKEGKAQAEINPIFKELADYTDYHFEFEEKYMKDFGYSNIEDHKEKHKMFLDTINSHKKEYEEGNIDTAYKVMIFLRKWVKVHITEDDKAYSALFRKNGLT